jgi:hypothetical protein
VLTNRAFPVHVGLSELGKRMREVTKSAVWALGISGPVSLFGAWGAMGLLHGSYAALIPFLPAIIVLYLCGSTGPFPVNSDAVILTIAFIAQFLAYFVVVLGVRAVHQRVRNKYPQLFQ